MKYPFFTDQISKKLLVKFKFAFLVILFLNIFLCNVCHAQNVSDFTELNDVDFPLEKIYLHIDKTLYTAGDDLWFKVYLVDADTHKPDALSSVVYVDIISSLSEILSSRTIKIDEGCGNGDFKLPIDLGSGEYTVRAYTTHMRNFDDALFFRKKIYINSVRQNISEIKDSIPEEVIEGNNNYITEIPKPDVQFFPEGGYLVCGFLNQIGIKIVGTDGKGMDISGTIVDNTFKKVAEFSTLKFGLGMVKMIPREGEKYKVGILYNGIEYFYDLPDALINGVIMQVTEDKDFYKVIVFSSFENGVGNFTFISTQKNKVVSITKIPGNDFGKKLIIPKNVFNEGIAQFTLIDDNNIPLCERMVFVEASDSVLKVNLVKSKKEYGIRELVELDIFLEQPVQIKPEANMSAAVAQFPATQENYALDIKSHLLLKSEIRGEIEQPGYFFHSSDPQRKKILDLLMMTQGWRRFIWNDSLKTNAPALTHPTETGLRLEGAVAKFYNRRKQKKAIISLTCDNNDEFSQYETNADEHGHFKFENITFWDSTSIVIQAKDNKGKESSKENPGNYYIEMDSLSPPIELADRNFYDSTSEIFNHNYPVSSLSTGEIDSLFIVKDGDILLDEVLVTGKKIDRIAKKRLLYKEPSHHVNFEKLRDQVPNQNVLNALNGRIPGFEVRGNTVVFRGGRSTTKEPGGILFLLDGFPVSMETILSVPIMNIHFVDMLRGPKATIYGSMATNMVVAVYTLDAEDILDFAETKERKGIISFIHPGFSKAREFYVPVYTRDKSTQKIQDNRSTLYWNPAIKLDEQGNSKVSFYTSDLPATYKIVLEGISTEGEIINSETFFDVNK